MAFAPTASALNRPTAPDVRVYSAAGVRQWLDCRGTGPLTVVVVTGLGSTVHDWNAVHTSFDRVTRTCFYDRPGLGNSPARPRASQVVNAGLYAQELWALLTAAREPGPYVVVGHSYGGLIARAFVHQHLSSVAGVLLAESVDPGDKTLGKYWSEAGHLVDLPASQRATGGGPRLGNKPLVVLSASAPDRDHLTGPTYGQPKWMTNLWVSQQRADTRLSSSAIQVIARSGHVLQQDNPAATEQALRVLVHAVESRTKLSCGTNWKAVHSTCRA